MQSSNNGKSCRHPFVSFSGHHWETKLCCTNKDKCRVKIVQTGKTFVKFRSLICHFSFWTVRSRSIVHILIVVARDILFESENSKSNFQKRSLLKNETVNFADENQGSNFELGQNSKLENLKELCFKAYDWHPCTFGPAALQLRS